MAVRTRPVVQGVTYQVGDNQYIPLIARHSMGNRSIVITKDSGSGTLDIYPIEFSVDNINWANAYSLNGGAQSTANATATNQSIYMFAVNLPFPYIRLKVKVNTASVVLSVSESDVSADR